MRLSWTHRHQLKQVSKEIARLAVTVAVSVLATLYYQQWVKESASGTRRAKTAKPGHGADTWNQELGDFYSEYLSEVLRALRADPKVRMARWEAPHGVLSYQRNVATLEQGGSAYRLQARGKTIPVVAVSRNSKAFLEEMRITYIDPERIPDQVMQAGFSVPKSTVKQFLLIPDVSAGNMKRFAFGSR